MKRMLGLDDNSDNEDIPNYDVFGGGLGVNGKTILDDEDDEGSESDAEESLDDDGSSDAGDDNDTGSDEPVGSSEDDVPEHENLVTSSNPSKRKAKAKSSAKYELPFTFPCPAEHDEFLEIVEDIADEDIPTVVQRIRALHHTSLAAENKSKLQVRT